jgi:hypothetical protein
MCAHILNWLRGKVSALRTGRRTVKRLEPLTARERRSNGFTTGQVAEICKASPRTVSI